MNTHHFIQQTTPESNDLTTAPTVIDIIKNDPSKQSLIDIINLVQHILDTQGDWFSVRYHQHIISIAGTGHYSIIIPYIHCPYRKQLQCFAYQYRELKKAILPLPLADNTTAKPLPQTDSVNDRYPIHQLNPFVDLFLTHLRHHILTQRIHLEECWFNWSNIKLTDRNENTLYAKVAELNHFIEQIRLTANSKAFNVMVSNALRMVKQNENSLIAYINQLFEQRSKLLVLRIDLGYHKITQPRLTMEDIEQDYLHIRKDFKHLLDNRRSNKRFEHLLGYAWKLEFAVRRGFHIHALFFFDGAKVREDIVLAKWIGDYWVKTITDDNGVYFNCNGKKRKYKRCGIGMIKHFDTEMRANLEQYVSSYLVKPDYYAKLNAPFIERTFGKGEITTVKDTRGRPRGSML